MINRYAINPMHHDSESAAVIEDKTLEGFGEYS